MKKTIIKARCISPGVAEGEALVSKSRISFWGGADVMKGIFTERGHELENCSFKDKILVFQSTKGSSGTNGMLKWSKINGVAPRAFINSDLDALAVLSCVACKFPMVAEPEEDVFSIIKTGDWVKVDATNGIIEVTHKE